MSKLYAFIGHKNVVRVEAGIIGHDIYRIKPDGIYVKDAEKNTPWKFLMSDIPLFKSCVKNTLFVPLV